MSRSAQFPCFVLLLALLLVSTPAAAETYDWENVYRPGGELRDGMWVHDRLVVTFEEAEVPRPSLNKAGEVTTGRLPLDRVNQQFGVRAMERLFPELPAVRKAAQPAERARVFSIDFDGQAHSLRSVAQAYEALDGVTSVEPVGIHYVHANVPNDPSLGSQWWLRNPAVGGADIRAVAAWYHSTGSSDVIVCDADSGVDWQHPDLGGTGPDYTDGVIWINETELNGNPGVDDDANGKIDDIRGWDWVHVFDAEQDPPQDSTVPDNDPMDYGSHGTWVAGCISAISDNGLGITSTNWNAKVMACRIGWTPDGSNSGVVRMDFAAQAMDYARLMGADIYNASWGSSNSGGLGTAVNQAVAAGMIIVTSAGNADNTDASYLCARSDVIAVAATNSNDAKASFSSYGSWVDISAPGDGIYTTEFNRAATGAAQHTYGAPSGTSFSSPIVAGAFALLKAVNPGMTRQQLIDKLLSSVDDIYDNNPTYIGDLGSGRLNLAKFFDNPLWLIPDQFPTLLDAMNTAEVGDSIAVVGGTVLDEKVTIQDKGLRVLGGWDPTFTTRDPVNNPAILEPVNSAGPVVQTLVGVDSSNLLDGFVVRGGKANFFSFEPGEGYFGGGVLIRDASPVLRNIRIENCIAGTSTQVGAGGGVAVLGGEPLFENVEITGNSARSGAAIYVHQGGPVFRDVDIHDNVSYTAESGATPLGGAVYVLNATGGAKKAAAVTFENGSIRNHTVAGAGGGVHSADSDLVMNHVTVENNVSGGAGGGVYVTGGSFTGTGNLFSGNQAGGPDLESGGGIATTGASVSVDSTRVEGNTATFSGAGAHFASATSLSVTNSHFVGNSGGFVGAGAALEQFPAGAVFSGNTVADNFGASAGANGLYVAGSQTLAVSNSIFAFNGGGGTSLADGVACQSGTVTFDCNLAFANDAGNYGGCPDPTGTSGNVSADPLFCDTVQGNYAVAVNSPAAAAQSGCGTMGAGGESCGVVAAPDGPVSPRRLALDQNQPNPFNPSTSIAFEIPRDTRVQLRVFDLRGRLVRVLKDETMQAGRHVIQWKGRDESGRSVASGAYFYELRVDGERRVRKMGLLK